MVLGQKSNFFPRIIWYLIQRPKSSAKNVYVSFVVCERYELVLPIRFECHYCWDLVPLSINTIQLVITSTLFEPVVGYIES